MSEGLSVNHEFVSVQGRQSYRWLPKADVRSGSALRLFETRSKDANSSRQQKFMTLSKTTGGSWAESPARPSRSPTVHLDRASK